jgi:hypothetical protein
MSKFVVFVLAAAAAATLGQASYVRELRVFTASCDQCGMTALGEISVKVQNQVLLKTCFLVD